MPRISKQSAKYDDYGPVQSWHDELDGHAVEFVQFKQDIDSTPMLKGLPNDLRSEERRVGKECRSRWSPYH